MLQKLKKLIGEKGQGIVEYALIIGFVAVVVVGLISSGGLQDTVKNSFDMAKQSQTDLQALYNNE